MNATTRAKKGGETGMNGEFYAGGTFLPKTKLGKMAKTARVYGSGKQEIEPYKWEVAPEGKKSIYRKIAGIIGTADNKTAKIRTDDRFLDTLEYLGMKMEEAQNIINLYNAGERWM